MPPMIRVLNSLLLLVAMAAQGVFASPAGWRHWDLAADAAQPAHGEIAASCRCCHCQGTACCAVPAPPRVPAPEHAVPLRPITVPEGSGAPSLFLGSGSWLLLLLPDPDAETVSMRLHSGSTRPPMAPAFLCGGGLLI